jgi:hypothetical protein
MTSRRWRAAERGAERCCRIGLGSRGLSEHVPGNEVDREETRASQYKSAALIAQVPGLPGLVNLAGDEIDVGGVVVLLRQGLPGVGVSVQYREVDLILDANEVPLVVEKSV